MISQEAEISKNEQASYSEYRNYDDLNEYFWSSHCFSLGWPIRGDGEFFKLESDLKQVLLNFLQVFITFHN